MAAILVLLSALILPAAIRAQPAGALHAAVGPPDVTSLVSLLVAGADPNERDARGLTPLMRAASLGRVEAARVLPDHGADTRYRDLALWTAGMHARETGQAALVELLHQRETRQGVLNSSGVRLRSRPDLQADVLGMLGEGDLVAVVGITSSAGSDITRSPCPA